MEVDEDSQGIYHLEEGAENQYLSDEENNLEANGDLENQIEIDNENQVNNLLNLEIENEYEDKNKNKNKIEKSEVNQDNNSSELQIEDENENENGNSNANDNGNEIKQDYEQSLNNQSRGVSNVEHIENFEGEQNLIMEINQEINNDAGEEDVEEMDVNNNESNKDKDISTYMDDDCSELAKIYKELNSKKSELNASILQKKEKIKNIEKNLSDNQRKEDICGARIKKSEKDLKIYNEILEMVSSTLSNLKKVSFKLRKSIEHVLKPILKASRFS